MPNNTVAAATAMVGRSLLHNAGELEVVAELKGTPGEERLLEAVSLAESGDAESPDAIHVGLQEVHRVLRRGPQA